MSEIENIAEIRVTLVTFPKPSSRAAHLWYLRYLGYDPPVDPSAGLQPPLEPQRAEETGHERAEAG